MSVVPKDLTLNWKIPKLAGRVSSVDPNFIRIKNVKKSDKRKYSQIYIHFSKAALNKHFGTQQDYRVAFSFEKDRLIAVFNPPKNVAAYRMSKNGDGRNIGNVDLVDEVWKYFNLGSQETYLLRINYFAEINNMKLFVLMPCKLDKTPILDYAMNDGEV